MKPYDYQVQVAKEGLPVLQNHGAVYFAMEERTGKTLTSMVLAELVRAKRVLIITKAKALPGWLSTIEQYSSLTEFAAVSWHQAYKVNTHFDLVILDEAHAFISGYPKPGKICKEVRALVYGKPIIYLSATPYAQGPQLLYHQFAMWCKSPWGKYKNFYQWHRVYGKPYYVEINGIKVNQYDRVHDDKVLADVQHVFIAKTRAELGFEQEPEDKLHYIELGEVTKRVYNTIVKDQLVELKAGWLVCDTASKLRYSLHQLEGGTAKIDNKHIVLANREKIDYILSTWGDSKDLVIMYNYKAEAVKLAEVFKNAVLLQATSYAEGVDLSMYKHLVIYSQDFSTAKHTQRRARQANKKRTEAITVHFLLVKGGISARVYQVVSKNKKNFVDKVFEVIK